LWCSLSLSISSGRFSSAIPIYTIRATCPMQVVLLGLIMKSANCEVSHPSIYLSIRISNSVGIM
jgi:hypothetical protein